MLDTGDRSRRERAIESIARNTGRLLRLGITGRWPFQQEAAVAASIRWSDEYPRRQIEQEREEEELERRRLLPFYNRLRDIERDRRWEEQNMSSDSDRALWHSARVLRLLRDFGFLPPLSQPERDPWTRR